MFENNLVKLGTNYRIYAKEEQIKVINTILRNLCIKELTSEGRVFLHRMKEDLELEIQVLKKKHKTEASL